MSARRRSELTGPSVLAPIDPSCKLSANDRVVIVMGPTGAGKSTFVNHATQQNDQSIGHSLESHTPEIRAVRANHPNDQGPVIFVDTPGFDDTYRSDVDILSHISGWLVKAYKEKVPLSAIVYLHRISDNRLAGSPLKNLQMFASMCGKAAMPRVVICTTMWSRTVSHIGTKREKELKDTFWADMVSQGCTVKRFADSYDSAWNIVGKLPRERENVILSREIYDDKKRLNETAAGIKLNEKLCKLILDQKEAARRIEREVQDQDNPALVVTLQQRQAVVQMNINGVGEQLQMLKIPLGRKIIIFFSGQLKPRKSGIHLPRGGYNGNY